MPSAISITTLTGIRLDVYKDATIEVNMGGLSLLSLADRTISYTNTLNLPRTKTNDQVFGFASVLSIYNCPSIQVIVQSGIFQKGGVLTYVSSGPDYNCSLSFDDLQTVADLKTFNAVDFKYDYFNPIVDNIDAAYFYEGRFIEPIVTPLLGAGKMFSPLVLDKHIQTAGSYGQNTSAILLPNLLDALSSNDATLNDLTLKSYNITFDYSLISEGSPFYSSFMFIPSVYFAGRYSEADPPGFYHLDQLRTDGVLNVILISDLIKVICQLFFLDVKIENRTITFRQVSDMLDYEGYWLENFTGIKKYKLTEYLNTNRIVYTIQNSAIYNTFAQDIFTVTDLIGDKEALKIDNVLPFSKNPSDILNGYWDTSTEDAKKAIIIMQVDTHTTPATRVYDGSNYTFDNYLAKAINLEGIYSTSLNPIFAKPIIVEVSVYINPFLANQIMDKRVIRSKQLVGRYWVETMAYNMITGLTKMKLIKLP